MDLRELVYVWHLAMHTKAWRHENELWTEIERRQLKLSDSVKTMADWGPLVAIQPFVHDVAWFQQARESYRTVPVLTRFDASYPPRLAESNQPPLVLFYRGRLSLLPRLTLAVVGARTATRYTRQALERLANELPPLAIVSGLAAGADTFALEMALSHGWPTIAVIANGMDRVYPASNLELQARIAEEGLLLSEYPAEVWPAPYRFVARNRIIAGLAHGVLVTEAARKSGSLITANYALQNNREVFALPNRLGEALGTGTNELLQVGAKLVQSGANIMEELQFFP